jgi:hypothetical protein
VTTHRQQSEDQGGSGKKKKKDTISPQQYTQNENYNIKNTYK